MMASFPPNKSYEVVWAQPDQKQRRPRVFSLCEFL